jgi:hypothetical protein
MYALSRAECHSAFPAFGDIIRGGSSERLARRLAPPGNLVLINLETLLPPIITINQIAQALGVSYIELVAPND